MQGQGSQHPESKEILFGKLAQIFFRSPPSGQCLRALIVRFIISSLCMLCSTQTLT